MSSAFVPGQQQAAIDYIPILFLIYIAFAVISALFRAARQATRGVAGSGSPLQHSAPPQQPAPVQPGTPAQQQPTADQVRAALERRLAAMAAARAAAIDAQSSPAPIVQKAAPIIASPPAPPITPISTAAAALLAAPLQIESPAPAADLTTLLGALPLGAQAVVASAVIGPCAAHRGGGHQPEDW